MHIQSLNHLRSNPMIRFKIEEVDGVPVEIVSYMIGNKELWEDPATLETRGNVYDVKTGECICACFPKFFNVGEREDIQPEMIKNQIVEVFEKRDGSMITPVIIDSAIFWKTKKSFFSEVAVLAAKNVNYDLDHFAWKCQAFDYTPIFEFTHPETRIVLDYGTAASFTLLAIRSNKTGKFMSWGQVEMMAKEYNIPAIQKFEKTWEELMHDVEHKQGIEGYVLVLKDGRRVKLKTKWYLEMHRTMTELRERDVAEAVINETIDDIKSLLVSQGKELGPIEAIEKKITEEIAALRDQVAHILWANSDKSVKDLALEMKGHPLFSLIMTEKRGKEAFYSDFWKRNHLAEVSLRCVYNQNF